MSIPSSSLLDLKKLNKDQILSLFAYAKILKEDPRPLRATGDTAALLFFEPSTRTRISFEAAAHRIGLKPLVFDGGISTSLEKGETVEDSILNIAAMLPRVIVIRCGDHIDLRKVSTQLKAPVVNAGWGLKGHPTQALLDAFTIQEHFQNLQNKKLLIIGDIIHSRVAASHLELAEVLNMQVGLCGPKELLPKIAQVPCFDNLEQGLRWADAVMCLRVQFERHQGSAALNKESYRLEFGLNAKNLKLISPQALIMHPGPINHGIEMESEVLADPRCKVFEQVTNGVFIREAILRSLIGDPA